MLLQSKGGVRAQGLTYYWREESPEKLRELYRSSPSLFSKMVLGDHTWAMELCFPKVRASHSHAFGIWPARNMAHPKLSSAAHYDF